MIVQSVHVAAFLLLKNHRPRVLRAGQSFNFEFRDEALLDVTDYQNGAVVPARLLADAHSTIKRLMRMAQSPPPTAARPTETAR
jgi:hypothetical protein